MPKLYVFNPENDIALACKPPSFTAPKNALLMGRYCASIMVWLAGENNYVLVEEMPDERYIKRLTNLIGFRPKFVSDPSGLKIDGIEPWGWSWYLKSQLEQAGIDKTLLPDDEKIEKMRMLSHRRTSIEINRLLSAKGIDVRSEAIEAKSVSEVRAYYDKYERVVLKAPWSSSGRGVADSTQLSREMFEERCKGIIRRQGSVVMEKYLDKVMDFAMLFEMRKGKARFYGLSRFKNSRMGSYDGNIIASQEKHEYDIGRLAGYDQLRKIKYSLADVLEDVLGDAYEGYCGVDMMVYRDENKKLRTAPCIELNLRPTMGVISSEIASRLDFKGNEEFILRTDYDGCKSALSQTKALIDLTPPNVFTVRIHKSEVAD